MKSVTGNGATAGISGRGGKDDAGYEIVMNVMKVMEVMEVMNVMEVKNVMGVMG
jgi:hypothetical protein